MTIDKRGAKLRTALHIRLTVNEFGNAFRRTVPFQQ
jgi:hypothetical protein